MRLYLAASRAAGQGGKQQKTSGSSVAALQRAEAGARHSAAAFLEFTAGSAAAPSGAAAAPAAAAAQSSPAVPAGSPVPPGTERTRRRAAQRWRSRQCRAAAASGEQRAAAASAAAERAVSMEVQPAASPPPSGGGAAAASAAPERRTAAAAALAVGTAAAQPSFVFAAGAVTAQLRKRGAAGVLSPPEARPQRQRQQRSGSTGGHSVRVLFGNHARKQVGCAAHGAAAPDPGGCSPARRVA
jgi:hypothetical protein